ncbi:MAG TPA: peptidylprolyl isomerase [Clostridia bacterium]|nr:peptidylprolyl isomerase [Clostridia bacterium]
MLSGKMILRALAMTLVVVMAVLAFAGCSATNPNATVMLVGDIKIGMTKYYSLYSSYKNFYNSYGLYDVSTAEKLRNFQDLIFDYLAESYLPYYWAKQNGVTLSEEEEAKVQADFETQLNEYLDGYKGDVDDSLTDETDIRSAEMTLFKKDLRKNGWTYKEYIGMMMENIRAAAVSTKFMNGIYEERVNVTDDDVKANYDSLLESEKVSYETTPAQYFTDYKAYIDNGAQQPLVAPEGYRFVKHILIKFAEEGETKDVDAIVAEVQAKIEAGENFDELMKEYTEDVDANGDPNYPNGYLISEDVLDQYDEAFGVAAIALKNVGDISAPVKSTYGYHIILFASAVGTEPLKYDDVKDAMKENMITSAKSDVYKELLEQWKADTEIVKYYNRVNAVR